jgi:hypothetical protein
MVPFFLGLLQGALVGVGIGCAIWGLRYGISRPEKLLFVPVGVLILTATHFYLKRTTGRGLKSPFSRLTVRKSTSEWMGLRSRGLRKLSESRHKSRREMLDVSILPLGCQFKCESPKKAIFPWFISAPWNLVCIWCLLSCPIRKRVGAGRTLSGFSYRIPSCFYAELGFLVWMDTHLLSISALLQE